ncbi:DCC1-like thiol-disulfide oxidoreductase family protein [Thermoactinomyces sp. DSM 45892]|uniref:DCC1-like thiol-disulfide oxidoreductase family protein n=1 Tax=Thermoactinomyces sp. DSM 45892 TaxID=1882753 RepID=UPI00089D6ABD|nr:DCC1-like thiol-disulfide oxidoreductase family protein [Thermoactinomyces sp. DSM 45892]SDY46153.1 Predicted thiol-disulfide oxidoreductase YuxK, DCC family [Thermoactinomyces sp. DSM 45892]
MFDYLIRWNQKKQMLIGASLIRIAFGCIILYMYCMQYQQRHILWGPNGIIDFSDFVKETFYTGSFSLYQLSSSSLYFEVIFHVGILIALLCTLGYRGRIISILNFVFVWSLFARNGIISDGGDNIIRILLFYLLFADTTSYFSVDAYHKSKSNKAVVTKAIHGISLRNLLHNLAVLACMVQVSLLYLTSGLHKAMGVLWQKGTALYYILQVDEYSHPFFREIISSSETLLVAGAYFAVLVQIAFPFLLFNRYTKYLAMAGVIGMHFGIFVVMGLFSFSFTMIANQLLFLKDSEYRRLKEFFVIMRNRVTGAVSNLIRKWKPSSSSVEPQSFKTVLVFYDGWCPFCISSIERFKKWDTLKRLEFVSFRDGTVTQDYGLDITKLEVRIHSLDVCYDRLEDGIDTIIKISRNIPLLWVLVPFLYLSVKLGFGNKVYDWIASRRTIIPAGNCNDKECLLPTVVKKID